MTSASKAAAEKRKLTQYLTNTVLDSQFRGTSQQFVLHFNEQFRQLDDLTDMSERMPDSTKMVLLQNAVKNIPLLSIVETLDEYTSTTSGHGSCAHLTYTSYYNLLINAGVRYDPTNTSTPSKRRNIYMQLPVLTITMKLRNLTKHFSPQTLIHHQMTSTRYIRPNKANLHLNHYLVFRGINPGNHLLLHPRNHSKNMMVLSISLLKYTSSSALKLLLPSKNTTQRPLTNLPRKESFMLQILQNMNHHHLRIPPRKNQLSISNLRIHLRMRLAQSWTILTARIIKRKI